MGCDSALHPTGSLNPVPVSVGVFKGRKVTADGWQVTLCDSIWHVISRSGEVYLVFSLRLILCVLLLYACICRLCDM